jgi:hypothetical protein
MAPPIRQNKAVLGCKSTCLLMLCIVYIMRCASLVFLNDRSRPMTINHSPFKIEQSVEQMQ